MYKYSVLCYIFNGYENVHEIGEKDPECEYLLITDDPNLKSDTWKVVYDPSLNGLSVFEKCHSVRYGLFKYASTNICIYLDASIGINKSLAPLINYMNAGRYDMVLMPHPLRNNFISEYKAWMQLRGYPAANAFKFMAFLNRVHYDCNYKGLFQTSFKVVRRGKLNDDIDRLTLALLKYLGDENSIERINQTAFSYIMNTYFSDIRLLPVSNQVIQSDYMTWYAHKTNTPIKFRNYDVSHPDYNYVFNERVQCMYMLYVNQ